MEKPAQVQCKPTPNSLSMHPAYHRTASAWCLTAACTAATAESSPGLGMRNQRQGADLERLAHLPRGFELISDRDAGELGDQ